MKYKKETHEIKSIHNFFGRVTTPIIQRYTDLQTIFDDFNDKPLIFPFRAPKIQLSPLSIFSIASSHKYIFDIDDDESISLAKATKGYAFAYQVLGDILFRYHKTRSIVMS